VAARFVGRVECQKNNTIDIKRLCADVTGDPGSTKMSKIDGYPSARGFHSAKIKKNPPPCESPFLTPLTLSTPVGIRQRAFPAAPGKENVDF
jgi:hypothetical protein